jgi:hypothetical protein
MTATIDTGQLLELVWTSAVAGAALSIIFSLLVLGLVRADDLRRSGRDVVAGAYLALAALAALLIAGGLVFGVSVIVSK